MFECDIVRYKNYHSFNLPIAIAIGTFCIKTRLFIYLNKSNSWETLFKWIFEKENPVQRSNLQKILKLGVILDIMFIGIVNE